MQNSIRMEELTQDLLDLIAYYFEKNRMTGDDTLNCIEIQLDDPIRNLFRENEDSLIRHRGSHYVFKHSTDDDWAIILMDDLKGDIARGKKMYKKYRKDYILDKFMYPLYFNS